MTTQNLVIRPISLKKKKDASFRKQEKLRRIGIPKNAKKNLQKNLSQKSAAIRAISSAKSQVPGGLEKVPQTTGENMNANELESACQTAGVTIKYFNGGRHLRLCGTVTVDVWPSKKKEWTVWVFGKGKGFKCQSVGQIISIFQKKSENKIQLDPNKVSYDLSLTPENETLEEKLIRMQRQQKQNWNSFREEAIQNIKRKLAKESRDTKSLTYTEKLVREAEELARREESADCF